QLDEWPGFHCSHAHCDEKKLIDVLNYFTPSVVNSYCRTKVKSKEKLHTPPSSIMKVTRLGEFLKKEQEPIQWQVDNLIKKGGMSLIAGKPKTGKTTLCRQLALAIARGESFLGRTTQKGKVIYFAFEEQEQNVQDHFKQMGATGDEEIYIN